MTLDAMAPDAPPPPIFPFRFAWSLDNGFSSAEIAVGDAPVPLPVEIGVERMTGWVAEAGFGLFDHGFTLKRRLAIAGTKIIPSGVLFIRTGLTSSALCQREGGETLAEAPGQYSLHLSCRPGDTVTITYDAGEPAFGLAPIITEDRLRSMLGGRKVPPLIERFLDGRGADFSANPRSSATMNRIVREIRHNPYQGGMSDLFVQGKVHEMLAEALTDLAGSTESVARVVGPDSRRALTARDLVLADLANPPSMEALSRAVGLSQRRLNEVFRAVFGATVFEWLVDQRLALATDLLRDGDLPIKEIAFRLGYAHLSTFTTAFARRFGTSPARYRAGLD